MPAGHPFLIFAHGRCYDYECSEDFKFPPWEGCVGNVRWQGGVYPLFQTNNYVDETPPCTLPKEGVAQSHALLFLPNTYGIIIVPAGCLPFPMKQDLPNYAIA